MTNKSDCELQKWIQDHIAPDYTNEDVQKRTVIFEDMGHSVTLYEWIHRYDNPEPATILDIGDMAKLWSDEYKKFIIEEMTNG
jgi:hypothetical protein